MDELQRPKWQWEQEAACRTLTPKEADQVFNNIPRGRPAKNAPYRKFCDSCPVKYECLNYAVVHEEEGIWGGFTRSQRDLLPTTFVRELRQKARTEGWYENHDIPFLNHQMQGLTFPEIPDYLAPLDQSYLTPTQEQELDLFGFC